MPVGQNEGHQLNLLIFEVVAITTDPTTGAQSVGTISVHPLVVAPSLIQYSTSSRTAVAQTIGGSQVNRAPRAFQQVTLAGTWGVEERGIFPYLGTGDVRRERFYNEVICMSDAIDRRDVDACVNILTGTPLLKLLLARYYARPDDTCFGVNFYDLLNRRRFQCVIRGYRDTRSHRNGGATGLVGYNFTVEECGPPLAGSPLLTALVSGLTTLSAVNQAILTYNVQNLVNSAAALPGIFLDQLVETQEAVISQIDAVSGLLGGATNSQNENLNSFLADCQRLQDLGNEAIAAIQAVRSPTIDDPKGGIAWDSPPPDLPSADAVTAILASDAFQTQFLQAMDESDVLDALEDLAEAAAFNRIAGVYFGFGVDEYQLLLSGSSSDPRPTITGSIPHTVGLIDTPASLEELYGIDFDAICAWNDATPDEALVTGRRLDIPQTQQIVGIRQTTGLPVFGSQLGQAAWGTDLRADLLTDDDGDFVILAGTDLLAQGGNWLIEEAQDDLLRFANQLPEVGRAPGLEQKVIDVIAADRRIVSVDQVAITIDPDSSVVSIATTSTAINAGLVSTGA